MSDERSFGARVARAKAIRCAFRYFFQLKEEFPMNRWYRGVVVAVCACLLAANWAFAQQSERPRGGGMGAMGGGAASFFLLRSEQVQQELKLSEDQKAKLQEAGQQVMNDFMALRDVDPAQRAQKMEEVQKTINDKVNTILSPDQAARLKQISTQLQGSAALMNPEVAQELGLSEDQKEKLKDVFTGMQSKFGELRNAAPEERAAKTQQLRKEMDDQALPILTAQQREKFDKMQGAKFELDMSSLMGGRRPGGQP
jgi:Spy/CpxP family protein refolding chaperone